MSKAIGFGLLIGYVCVIIIHNWTMYSWKRDMKKREEKEANKKNQ